MSLRCLAAYLPAPPGCLPACLQGYCLHLCMPDCRPACPAKRASPIQLGCRLNGLWAHCPSCCHGTVGGGVHRQVGVVISNQANVYTIPPYIHACTTACRYYDVIVGDGDEAQLGKRVVIHFECKWKVRTAGAMLGLEQRQMVAVLSACWVIVPIHTLTPARCPPHRVLPVPQGITFITSRQGMGVTGGSPLGFDVGAHGAGGTLKGLDLGVRGMRVGGRRKLKVPPALGYGDKGRLW